MERNLRKERTGVVLSNKMDKTITIAAKFKEKHPIYGKFVSKTKKYHAHDEKNECNVGDMQTFSKAWGCAAIRLGMAFASPEIIGIFNKIKYPYNVNRLTQEEAIRVLQHPETIKGWVNTLLEERARVMEEFVKLPCCVRVFPTDANFFLAKVYEATQIYNYLVSEGIIVRNRTNVALCNDCLRITIGTKEENEALLDALRKVEIE